MRTLRLPIQELIDGSLQESSGKGLPVRVVWSRGKKEAKTQYKYLDASSSAHKYDEKIQINTVLELHPETQMPTKEKVSRLAVALNRNYGYKEIAEVNFDLSDFKYNRYNGMRLFLSQVPSNTEYNLAGEAAYIEIGIRGTRADGLVMQRMSQIKSKMQESIKRQMGLVASPIAEETSQQSGSAYQDEIERLKKETESLREQLEAANQGANTAKQQVAELEDEK